MGRHHYRNNDCPCADCYSTPPLHRYRITYRCALDPGCPDFATIVRAYDRRHAEERFYDSDDQDWIIISIERCADA